MVYDGAKVGDIRENTTIHSNLMRFTIYPKKIQYSAQESASAVSGGRIEGDFEKAKIDIDEALLPYCSKETSILNCKPPRGQFATCTMISNSKLIDYPGVAPMWRTIGTKEIKCTLQDSFKKSEFND